MNSTNKMISSQTFQINLQNTVIGEKHLSKIRVKKRQEDNENKKSKNVAVEKGRYDSHNKSFCERDDLDYLSIPLKIKKKL